MTRRLSRRCVLEDVATFQYDFARSGWAPDETGPTTAVSERWRFETGGALWSSPVVVDGTLYVGSDDASVYALEDG